ncbi:hypothetical protein [Methanobacterium sp.]|uniref:hypothetical protein n=1 Tax=Methanobacterium sp. TaxID=2164 RepID=UPI003D65E730
MDYFNNSLIPIIPVIIRKIHKILPFSLDSPNKIIPIITIPTAPIPVPAAYQVPMGMSFNAKESK